MRKPQFGGLSRIEKASLIQWTRQALVLTAVLVLCGGLKNASSGGLLPQAAAQWPDSGLAPGGRFGLSDPAMEQKRLRAINAERQRLMAADTEKLLKLVRALNDEVEKNHPDSLTPSQLRAVAEIEKLAHSVKEKMSYSYMGGPEFRELPHTPGSIR
jgi:hypothetical protein